MSTYKCERCGVISDRRQHICQPEKTAGGADYCGSAPDQSKQICEQMAQHLDHRCARCGRPAENPELLCKPAVIR